MIRLPSSARSGRSAAASRRAVTVCGALAICAALAAPTATGTAALPTATPTTGTIGASFSPDRFGAKAALSVTVRFAGGVFGVPAPLSRVVVHFPPGLRMHIPSLRACTRARLQARGARGCPARSQIGAGHALADVHAGAEIESEEATVWAFLGPPQNGNPTIEIVGQGYTPLDERVVMTGTVLPDSLPYGEELAMSVPAIPTLPLEPNASMVSLSLTLGGRRFRAHNPNTVVVPSRCPAGGFPFGADFTYADGSTSSAVTTAPCP
jgi:hypothetical protein